MMMQKGVTLTEDWPVLLTHSNQQKQKKFPEQCNKLIVIVFPFKYEKEETNPNKTNPNKPVFKIPSSFALIGWICDTF